MKTRKLLTALIAVVVSAFCALTMAACLEEYTEPQVVLTLDRSTIDLTVGDTHKLTATATAENVELTWISSDSSVVSVSEDGTVTALQVGSATVTVKLTDDMTAMCTVTVKAISAEGVTLDKDSVTLLKNDEYTETCTLTATVSPATATDKGVEWSSSDDGVATVADGVVTAVSAGNAVITAKTADGEFTDECAVTVKAATDGCVKALAVDVTLNDPVLSSIQYGGFDTYWLKYTAVESGRLRVYVAGDSYVSQKNTVTLYDSADEVLQEGTDAKVALYENVTEGEVYYIKLSTAMTSGHPEILLEMPEDGAYKEIAKTAAFGTENNLDLEPGEACWYAFTVAGASEITASFGGSPENAEVSFEGKFTGATANYYEAGTYYVKVLNKDTADAAFTVTFGQRVLPDNEIPEGATKAKAFDITATFDGVKKTGLSKREDAWFKVSVETAHQVKIAVNNDNGIDHDYVWYDGSEQTPVHFEGGNGTLSIVKDLKADGEYYLQFKASDSVPTYDITFTMLPDGSSKEEAISAAIGNSYSVTAGEYWFALKLSSATDVVVYSTGDNAVTGDLCYGTGASMNETDKDSGDNFRFEKSLGAYTYYLKVTTTDANPDFTVVFAKLGGSVEGAAIAQIGQSYSIDTNSAYWMAVTPTEDTEVKANISGASTTPALYVNVFDYSLDSPRIGGANNAGTYKASFDFTVNLTAGKTYYINFTAKCNVEFTAMTPGCDENHAAEVSFDTADDLTLAASEAYWYKFTLGEPAAVTATVGGSPANVEVAYENKPAGTTAKYYEAGTYYVKVTNKDTAAATFTVTFEQRVLQESEMTGMIKSKAYSVTVGYTEYVSSSVDDNDVRWFTFTLDGNKEISFKSVTPSYYIVINYQLYKGEELVAQTFTNYEDGNFSFTKELDAGTYYLKTTRKSGSAYTVSVQQKSDGSCREGAIAASLSGSYSVKAGEYWFSVKPSSATDVVIYSTGDNNTKAELQDASGTALQSATNGGNGDNFRLEYSLAANTQYYLKVTTTDVDPDFTVAFGSLGSNNATAESMTIEGSLEITLGYGKDYWVTFEVPEGESGKFKISATDSSSNTAILYNSALETLISSVSLTSGGSEKELESGVYYIKISRPSVTWSSQTFSIHVNKVNETPPVSGGEEDDTVDISSVDAEQVNTPINKAISQGTY